MRYKTLRFGIYVFRMALKSRMWDGWVVVDGGMTFRFNDGATLILEMFEEDALRCVQL